MPYRGGSGPLNLLIPSRAYRSFLLELIEQDGDMTIPELAGGLADATGVQAHPDAIESNAQKLGTV